MTASATPTAPARGRRAGAFRELHGHAACLPVAGDKHLPGGAAVHRACSSESCRREHRHRACLRVDRPRLTSLLRLADRAEVQARSDWARGLLNSVRHPAVPPVTELHLPLGRAGRARGRSDPSPGLASPLIEEARILRICTTTSKSLSDLHRRDPGFRQRLHNGRRPSPRCRPRRNRASDR